MYLTMRKKRMLRMLPILILMIFLILYVYFQLRARSVVKHEATLSRSASQRSIQEALSTAKDAPTLDNTIKSDRHKDAIDGNITMGEKYTMSPLKLTDIFIAVKTTGKFHKSRLTLLLETWIPLTKAHTFIFTDSRDQDILSEGFNMVVTECPSDHSHQALSCKMAAEYDHFMLSDQRWLCHVDDDNYVNPEALLALLSAFPPGGDIYVGKPSLDRPITVHLLLEGNITKEVNFWFATGGAGFCLSRRLAQKMTPWASGVQFQQTSEAIRLPDDCTVGFIVERKLDVPMVHCPLFHSHLENLQLLSQRNIPAQVTLSYGIFENKMNSVEIKGSFSKEEDPSRFKSVHCILYPFTSWCP